MPEIMEALILCTLLAIIILSNLVMTSIAAPQPNKKLKIRNMFTDVYKNTIGMYENKNVFGYIYTSLFLIITIPGILSGIFIRFVITVILCIYRLGIK